jgi:hypothetical protein
MHQHDVSSRRCLAQFIEHEAIVGRVKLAYALSILTRPLGKVILAVAVELERVPVELELLTVVGLANCGISFTMKTVPTGMLVAVNVNGTGWVVPAGRETSAVV